MGSQRGIVEQEQSKEENEIMNERIRNNVAPTAPIDAACNWNGDFDVVVIGGGAAGIGVTASLLRRQSSLRIAIVEPQ